jgi:hypothetical protein
MQVSSDYDADADFTALHSYDWLPPPKIKSGDPKIQYGSLAEARVKRLVEEQLAGKGYVRDAGQPDFLLTCHVAVEDKVSVTYTNELYGYGPGWGTGYRRNISHYGYPGTAAMVSEYQQGTLLLDVVKADNKQLIWRGTATAEVYPELGQEAREKRLRKAVQKILARFPPPT